MSESGSPDPLDSIRTRRDELYEGILALERAISVPARGRAGTWAVAVQGRLDDLTSAWRSHVAGTEADDGLFAQVLDREPRLAHAVDRLRADHLGMSDAFAAAALQLETTKDDDAVEESRTVLLDLMHQLFEHRSRGAELVYDAYGVDLSAGD